jgi:hypothetical protein
MALTLIIGNKNYSSWSLRPVERDANLLKLDPQMPRSVRRDRASKGAMVHARDGEACDPVGAAVAACRPPAPA